MSSPNSVRRQRGISIFHIMRIVLVVLLALAATACQAGPGGVRSGTPGHVFVINLENKSYEKVWGTNSSMPYLSKTLAAQGVLLSQYYGIAHHSMPNYIAQISGQASNAMTRADCPNFTAFVQTGTANPGQALGEGCVYPASIPTVASQLEAAGKTWKAYMEDMAAPCEHPSLGAPDEHQSARAGDQYATRHNPFMYFEGITSSLDCAKDDVSFSRFAPDLTSVATTPNLAYVTPNLCNDGHDNPCADGSPGGYASMDAWLKREVPGILASPAYQQDGMLIITFDEAEGNESGPSGIAGGTAGGRIGALVLSPFAKGGTTSDRTYNHYSLLATIEDAFSLSRLGYAGAPGLNSFGADVYNGPTK